jgi:hypothetical protein
MCPQRIAYSTLEELVDPLDEKDIGEELVWNEEEIVNQVNRKKDGLVSDNEESDSNGEEKGMLETHLGHGVAIQICQQFEGYCLDMGGGHSLGLSQHLHRF